MDQKSDRYDVLGVPISVTSLSHASGTIAAWAQDATSRMIFVRDVHGVMQAQMNAELMQLHREAAMVVPDGMPLVWLGQRAGLPVSRTCGPDLMDRVMADSQANGLRHYLYGGKDGVAGTLKAVFEKKYPAVRIVGYETPPFRPLSAEEVKGVARDINASNADVVWIGVSTPKQEFLMHDLLPLTHATFIGVGAAYDFHIGAVKRAPRWMQVSGLEWLWRLMCEPRRLWRRYLIMAPQFVLRVVVSRLTRGES